MKTATVKFKSYSPILFGRFHNTEKLEKESHEDYEKRTWINKAHFEKDNVVIPQFMLKNTLSEAAKFLSIQIKGKGKSTYTKHFEAGIAVMETMTISSREKVTPYWLHVPSDGKRGGTTRVMRCFPKVDEWEGQATILILDDVITKSILQEHLTEAGKFIGFGALRPRNNGITGRFTADIISFE